MQIAGFILAESSINMLIGTTLLIFLGMLITESMLNMAELFKGF
jgi:hypothetical protein